MHNLGDDVLPRTPTDTMNGRQAEHHSCPHRGLATHTRRGIHPPTTLKSTGGTLNKRLRVLEHALRCLSGEGREGAKDLAGSACDSRRCTERAVQPRAQVSGGSDPPAPVRNSSSEPEGASNRTRGNQPEARGMRKEACRRPLERPADGPCPPPPAAPAAPMLPLGCTASAFAYAPLVRAAKRRFFRACVRAPRGRQAPSLPSSHPAPPAGRRASQKGKARR